MTRKKARIEKDGDGSASSDPAETSKVSQATVYPCPHCTVKFYKRKDHLMRHIQSDHPHTLPEDVRSRLEEKNYECSTCGKKFRRSDHYRNHEKTHNQKWVCEICADRFPRKCRLRNHILRHVSQLKNVPDSLLFGIIKSLPTYQQDDDEKNEINNDENKIDENNNITPGNEEDELEGQEPLPHTPDSVDISATEKCVSEMTRIQDEPDSRIVSSLCSTTCSLNGSDQYSDSDIEEFSTEDPAFKILNTFVRFCFIPSPLASAEGKMSDHEPSSDIISHPDDILSGRKRRFGSVSGPSDSILEESGDCETRDINSESVDHSFADEDKEYYDTDKKEFIDSCIGETPANFCCPFKCCSQAKFKGHDSFFLHLKKQHLENKRYVCRICQSESEKNINPLLPFQEENSSIGEFRFLTYQQLSQHQKECHAKHRRRVQTMPRQFPCPFCKFPLTSNYNLDVHIRAVHQHERRYQCHICHHSFPYNNVNRHLRVHVNKPEN